jgi:hypothetical protein
MPKFEFCLPTNGKAVPAGPEWFHEIKFDGYRLPVERDGDRVRLITRGGCDWTKRFPWIAGAVLKNRLKQFVIDGEAVILGVDGMSDFNALHSRKQTKKSNSVPSTCWQWMARISATSRSRSARPTWSGCFEAVRMASSSIHSRAARSDRIYSAQPAISGLRAWCQSALIALTVAAGRRTGSR